MHNKSEDKVIKQFGLSNFSLKNRITVVLIFILLVILGVGAYNNLPKESYPEVMLVALAAFSAYAAFVVLQHKLADVFFKDTVLTKDALEVAKREFQHGK